MNWWIEDLRDVYAPNFVGKPQYTILTDASLSGRGCTFPDLDEKFGGRLNSFEAQMHINALELSAILYSLRTTCSEMLGVHIWIMTDNITAKLLIQNQGSVCLFSVIQLKDKCGLGQLNVIFGFERHIYQVY